MEKQQMEKQEVYFVIKYNKDKKVHFLILFLFLK
jgi:hypothetical protein